MARRCRSSGRTAAKRALAHDAPVHVEVMSNEPSFERVLALLGFRGEAWTRERGLFRFG